MKSTLYLALLFCSALAAAQTSAGISDPTRLSDSVYLLLKPYPVILFGEMHGANESAPFVYGLARLFAEKGDSVLVGLEIPADQMPEYLAERSDSSVYRCRFFSRPPVDGRESVAWAELIARLSRMKGVEIFFFDKTATDPASCNRDSLMYERIKAMHLLHPARRLITLGGNYHNRMDMGGVMYDYMSRDRRLLPEICTLNLSYSGGACRANFGRGLEIKPMGNPASVPPGRLTLLPPGASYPYQGYYYCGLISPADMVFKQK